MIFFDSHLLKLFDYFVAANTEGNILPTQDVPSMEDEVAVKDIVRMKFGKVTKSRLFLEESNELYERSDKSVDNKQFIVDRLMENISKLNR